jgi:hypothetical protein
MADLYGAQDFDKVIGPLLKASVVRGRCEHNTIPVSRWFRRGWVCVRCSAWFKERPDAR